MRRLDLGRAALPVLPGADRCLDGWRELAARALVEGIGLRPFSVAYVKQPWRTPRMPGDLTIRWTRRSRALAADSWGGLEVPLGAPIVNICPRRFTPYRVL